MTIQTHKAQVSANSSNGSDPAALERSENEGMRDLTLKSTHFAPGETHRSAQNPELPSSRHSVRHQRGASPASAEATDLERRVLAHERILQVLIAHLTVTDPNLLARLSERFSEPMQMVRREHNHTDTDSHAEDFIRAVVDLVAGPASMASPPVEARASKRRSARVRSTEVQTMPSPAGIKIHENGGIWQITIDGRFYGDYMTEEQALEVVKNLA